MEITKGTGEGISIISPSTQCQPWPAIALIGRAGGNAIIIGEAREEKPASRGEPCESAKVKSSMTVGHLPLSGQARKRARRRASRHAIVGDEDASADSSA